MSDAAVFGVLIAILGAPLLVNAIGDSLQPDVVCKNCEYRGRPERFDPHSVGKFVFVLFMFFLSFLFWPLFFFTGFLFLVAILTGKQSRCQKCKALNPIPVDQWDLISQQSKTAG